MDVNNGIFHSSNRWNNLVAALDSVTLIGVFSEDGLLDRTLDWLVE